MQSISAGIKRVNLDVLDAHFRQALDVAFIGISTVGEQVVIHVEDSFDNVEEIQRIVQEHDASELSPRQHTRQQRQAAIQVARQQEEDVLVLTDFSDVDPLVRLLARKVRWLELELRDLRGLE